MNRINYGYVVNVAKVANVLHAAEVPYTCNQIFDGWQLRFPWCNGDIACHSGTYGNQEGKVESFCFPWDEGSVSVLEPVRMARKIIAYYEETRA